MSKQSLREPFTAEFYKVARTAKAIERRSGPPGFADSFQPADYLNAPQLLTHAGKLLAQWEDAPTDTPAALAAKAGHRTGQAACAAGLLSTGRSTRLIG